MIRTIIIMSITGGLISLLLLAIKPLIRHRLPKNAQYIFLLAALAAFLIPIPQFITLPAAAPYIAPIHNAIERAAAPQIPIPQEAPPPPVNIGTLPAVPDIITPTPTTYISAPQQTPPPQPLTQRAAAVFFLVYPFAALFTMLYSITGYLLFITKLRRNFISPTDTELALLQQMTIGKRNPRLIKSTHAATPMLIGVLKPTIVLPDKTYTTEQLYGIFLHELTHMRRYDVLVKWLSLTACALHWFNPLVWLTRREINRACELACDESVIRDMDANNKQHYGETLIAVAATTKIPLPVLSTTMCTEKKAIKERLTAIMKNKRHTRLAILASVIIILTIATVAIALGATRENETADTPPFFGTSILYYTPREIPAAFERIVRAATAQYGISAHSHEDGVAEAMIMGINRGSEREPDFEPKLRVMIRQDQGHVEHQRVYNVHGERIFYHLAAPLSTSPTDFKFLISDYGTIYLQQASHHIWGGRREYFHSFESGTAEIVLTRYAIPIDDGTETPPIEFTINGGPATEEEFNNAPRDFLGITDENNRYLFSLPIDLWHFAGESPQYADSPPNSHDFHANDYIAVARQSLNVGVFEYPNDDMPTGIRPANIIDTRINTFEMVAEFDDISTGAIELWRLCFMLQTDDLEGVVTDGEFIRWGTFSPDEDGWVGHHTGWNEARVLMVFYRDGEQWRYMGNIPYWYEREVNIDTIEGMETVLRKFLHEDFQNENSVTIYIEELAPGEEIAVARLVFRDDASYMVTVSAESGSRILKNLQSERTPGALRHSSSVMPENPRTTVMPFYAYGGFDSSMYLHIGNHDDTPMTGITVQIAPIGEWARIILLDQVIEHIHIEAMPVFFNPFHMIPPGHAGREGLSANALTDEQMAEMAVNILTALGLEPTRIGFPQNRFRLGSLYSRGVGATALTVDAAAENVEIMVESGGFVQLYFSEGFNLPDGLSLEWENPAHAITVERLTAHFAPLFGIPQLYPSADITERVLHNSFNNIHFTQGPGGEVWIRFALPTTMLLTEKIGYFPTISSQEAIERMLAGYGTFGVNVGQDMPTADDVLGVDLVYFGSGNGRNFLEYFAPWYAIIVQTSDTWHWQRWYVPAIRPDYLKTNPEWAVYPHQ